MVLRSLSVRSSNILALLAETGHWRSGEEISSLMGISRAAVAKHVTALRAMGHAIESAPKRGYRLLFTADAISAAEVGKYLVGSTLGHGSWRILEETGSTNNEAVVMAFEGAPEGSVVVAEQQTRGRGSKGKGWFSAPRSLQVSLLLRPELTAETLPWLTAAGTLAVADALSELIGAEATVKIPNDVLLGNKKIAGILAETSFRGHEVDWVVLGIGCNVNTLQEEFPPHLEPVATSIFVHTGRAVSRNRLLAAILDRVEYWYHSFDDGAAAVKLAWERRARSR